MRKHLSSGVSSPKAGRHDVTSNEDDDEEDDEEEDENEDEENETEDEDENEEGDNEDVRMKGSGGRTSDQLEVLVSQFTLTCERMKRSEFLLRGAEG